MFTVVVSVKILVLDLTGASKWSNATAQLQQMFKMPSYKMTIGPDQLILMSHKSTLLASCMYNESWHVVASVRHLRIIRLTLASAQSDKTCHY